MPAPLRVPRLLAAVRAAVKEQGTNPYQIAKATGLSVGSVQNLLSEKVSPSLHNIEVVMHALGLEVQVVKTGRTLAKPGRGRGSALDKKA